MNDQRQVTCTSRCQKSAAAFNESVKHMSHATYRHVQLKRWWNRQGVWWGELRDLHRVPLHVNISAWIDEVEGDAQSNTDEQPNDGADTTEPGRCKNRKRRFVRTAANMRFVVLKKGEPPLWAAKNARQHRMIGETIPRLQGKQQATIASCAHRLVQQPQHLWVLSQHSDLESLPFSFSFENIAEREDQRMVPIMMEEQWRRVKRTVLTRQACETLPFLLWTEITALQA